MCTSIWGFLFTFFYYFVTGMWRKGLVILGMFLVILGISVGLDYNSRLLAFLPSFVAMAMAFGDQYRTKVLKETFWF
jgi:hypothetical protein